MKVTKNFELVCIGDEHMAIPFGEEAVLFKGTVALSEAAYYLLEKMKTNKTQEDLQELLMNEYDIDSSTAKKDIETYLKELLELGVIEE